MLADVKYGGMTAIAAYIYLQGVGCSIPESAGTLAMPWRCHPDRGSGPDRPLLSCAAQASVFAGSTGQDIPDHFVT